MRKTTLLLALCLPIGWIAWIEARQLLAMSAPQASEPGPAAGADDPRPRRPPKDPGQLQANAHNVVRSIEGLRASVIRLDDPPGGEGFLEVADALVAHGNARKASRERVEAERAKAEDTEEKLSDLLGRLQLNGRPRVDRREEWEQLVKRLEAGKSLPLLDAELYRSALVLADWIELDREHPERRLDELYRSLDRWTPTAVPADRGGQADLDAYRRFLEAHDRRGATPASGAVLDLINKARDRESRWDLGLKLAALLPKETGPVRWERRADQIRSVVELAARVDGAAAEVKRSARRVFRELCRALISEEPPDDGAIRPTEYAEAVRAFNNKRAELRDWDESDVRELLAVCAEHRSALLQGADKHPGGKDLIPRLERLLEIVRGRPGLSAATP